MTTTSKRTARKKADAHSLARRLAQLAVEKKAEDILILDLRGLSSACDFFVICSAPSEQQVKAIADHMEAELHPTPDRPWHVEGRAQRRWVLVDCVNVVAHVFHKETREYYMLERLWADAPREEIKDEPARKRRAPESEPEAASAPKIAKKLTKKVAKTTPRATSKKTGTRSRKSPEDRA